MKTSSKQTCESKYSIFNISTCGMHMPMGNQDNDISKSMGCKHLLVSVQGVLAVFILSVSLGSTQFLILLFDIQMFYRLTFLL